jgi:hypothetical protein
VALSVPLCVDAGDDGPGGPMVWGGAGVPHLASDGFRNALGSMPGDSMRYGFSNGSSARLMLGHVPSQRGVVMRRFGEAADRQEK